MLVNYHTGAIIMGSNQSFGPYYARSRVVIVFLEYQHKLKLMKEILFLLVVQERIYSSIFIIT